MNKQATAADGYARVAKRQCYYDPPRPWNTNATTGVANAALDAIPLQYQQDVPAITMGNIHIKR